MSNFDPETKYNSSSAPIPIDPRIVFMRSVVILIPFFLLASNMIAAEPADLRTRKSGADWPHFLGPTGDSISTEKGILSPWPNDGLKIVWHRDLGTGYGPPAVSRGRIFYADRLGNKARLT